MDIEDFELTVAGHQMFIRPAMDVARRVENAVGAIHPFAQKLEAGAATYAELSRLYSALVRADPTAPDAKAIDAWLFEVGAFAHRPTAFFLTTLIVGSEVLAREFARLQASAANLERQREASRSAGPFATTGASTTPS